MSEVPDSVQCPAGDPLCPCQDGDACHYADAGDTKAWPLPVTTEEHEAA